MVTCDSDVGSFKSCLRSLLINEYYVVECFHIFMFCFRFFGGGLRFLLGLCYTL